MAPARPGLLERERELQALDEALASAVEGRGAAVLVEGPAGVGKSSLLAAGRELASRRGMLVLAGHGGESERDFPFGLAAQLFEAHLRGLAGSERASLLRGPAAPAAELLGGAALGGRVEQDDQALFGLLHALHWLTVNLSESHPLALLVDDAQWSDPPTLRFLHYLARRLEPLPVALLLGVRSGEPATETDLLAAIGAEPAARVLRLAPLSPAAVERCVRDLAPDADPSLVAACADVTGGNPLLLRELLSTLREEGVPFDERAAATVRSITPDSVSRSILLRLSRFGPHELAVARAVAVLGDDAELASVAALARLDPTPAATAASRLAAADVIAAGEPLRFVHPLLRSAVYGDFPDPERRLAHAAAARMLRDRGAAVERVALHLLQAPLATEAWAPEVLLAAAERASQRGWPATAARMLERALREPLETAARVDVEAALARAELAAGEAAGAERLERAARSLPAGRRALALRDLGRQHMNANRFGDAARRFAEALALADPAVPLGRELRAAYAAAAMWVPELAGGALEGFEDIVAEGGQPEGAGERLLLGALAAAEVFRLGSAERAARLVRAAWGDGAWLEQVGSAEPTFMNLTGALSAAGEAGDALELAVAVQAAAAERGLPGAFATASYLRGSTALLAGDVRGAISELERALEALPGAWETWQPSALGFLGWARMEAGDEPGATEALGRLGPGGEGAIHIWSSYARGRVELARGAAADALAAFERTGRLMLEGLGTQNPAVMPWRAGAAEALARLGDRDRARALAEEELELARRFGASPAIGVALRALGLAEIGRQGAERLREAAALLARVPLERVNALTELGAMLRRAGEREAPRAVLREALDLADRCGAARLAARAREELVLAGGRPRRAALHGAAALTPAELRVAELAAQGRTNRQIAEALFLTPKTVSWHLGHVYLKLGVNDRHRLGPLLAQDPAAPL